MFANSVLPWLCVDHRLQIHKTFRLFSLYDFGLDFKYFIYIHKYTNIHTYIHTQTYIHACIHTHIHTITKGCPQGSCSGPGYWNILVQYNSLLTLRYTEHTKVIAFADDVVIMIKADSIREAENITNVELSKISKWAVNNKIRFNKHKSKVMLLTRRKRKERQEIYIHLNNKTLTQVQCMKYLGIMFDYKLTFKEHINYMAEN